MEIIQTFVLPDFRVMAIKSWERQLGSIIATNNMSILITTTRVEKDGGIDYSHRDDLGEEMVVEVVDVGRQDERNRQSAEPPLDSWRQPSWRVAPEQCRIPPSLSHCARVELGSAAGLGRC